MSKRTIRMRVRGGCLEPLEEMALPEGAEVVVYLDVPEDARQRLELKNGFYVFTGEVDAAHLDHRIDREERLEHLTPKRRS